MNRAVATTVATALATALACVLLRRWLLRGGTGDKDRRRVYILLVTGIAVLFLLSLAYIWGGQVEAFKSIHEKLTSANVYANLIATIMVILFVHLLSRGVEHAVLSGSEDVEARYKARRGILWAKSAIIVVVVAVIWLKFTKDFGVFLGIVGAGVAFALQEPLLCMAGWLLIILKKPFDVGDRVEIGGKVGDVIGINLFQTTMIEVGNWVEADQSTGRLVVAPNSQMWRSECYNYTKGFPFIWNELKTVVTFESDWKKARTIILKQAQEEAQKIEDEVRRQITEMQSRYAIRYERLSPIVYTDIAAHGVALTLRYLSPVRRRRETTQKICEEILEDFAKETDIDFAYPTTRFYDNAAEGKPGARAERPPNR